MLPSLTHHQPLFAALAQGLWRSIFGHATRDIPLSVLSGYMDTPPRSIPTSDPLQGLYETARMVHDSLQLEGAQPCEFWKDVMSRILPTQERFPELDRLIGEYFPNLLYYPAACVGPMQALYQAFHYMRRLPQVKTRDFTNEAVCLTVVEGDKTTNFGVVGGLFWREVRRGHRNGSRQTAYRRVETALWQGQSPKMWCPPTGLPNRVRLGLRGASLAHYLREVARADERVWGPVLALLESAKALNLMPAACRWQYDVNPMRADYFRLALAQVGKVDSPVLTKRQNLYAAVVPQFLDHERFIETFGDPLDLFENLLTDEHVIEKLYVILANV